jgi:hypothetical protein
VADIVVMVIESVAVLVESLWSLTENEMVYDYPFFNELAWIVTEKVPNK